MADFGDTLGGDGLFRACVALEALRRDPLRLDRARQRFNRSPPPCKSTPSGTTTRSASPTSSSEKRRRDRRRDHRRDHRLKRRLQLVQERMASEPYHRFEHQVSDEQERIMEADIPIGSDAHTIACEIVKKQWVEQGIWNSNWNSNWNQWAYAWWKHEGPLEIESEPETDSAAEPSPPHFLWFSSPQPEPRRPMTDDEKRQIAERRVVREREREASRPYHQFVYQISKDRERIQGESENGEGADAADINTRAYENVKNRWTKRGIWNKRWGVLPGMSWKHEQPFEKMFREEMCDDPVPASPSVNGSHEAHAVRGFGSPSSVPPNPRQVSSALNSCQQGSPADIASAGSENGDVEHPPSAPDSPRFRTDKRVLGPTTGQVLRPTKRRQSQKDGQPQSVASASLGPVHPSKVSKAARKTKPGRQRPLNISRRESSGGLPLSPGVDAAEPPPPPPADRVTPRRSKRIQPSISKDPAKTASADPAKGGLRSKPERKVASNSKARSSAEPQGVLKRQLAKTTRGKARKK